MTINITLIEERVSVKALKIAHGLMEDLTGGRETWKYPIKAYTTKDRELAVDIAGAFDYYLGGSEFQITNDGKFYSVSSLGYYHYIGA